MDFTTIFVTFITFNIFNHVYSIECYACGVSTESLTIGDKKTIILPCTNFNHTSAYVVDCTFSTMCSRIVSTMNLQNEKKQKTITLGCAQQKSSRHVLRNGVWKEEHSVKEIYSEECRTMTDNNLAGATKTYCYCRGRLCNSGNRYNFPIESVIFIIALTTVKIVS